MDPSISISGFTIVRNAEILDYPFEESILSMIPLCDEVVINCGDSQDDTLERCRSFERKFPRKIKIIQTAWETHNQTGGFQLKSQSDTALSHCKGNWCLYLQADEVLHEADRTAILQAIKRAHQIPEVDGVLFDYLHFYASYDYTIQGRNWYRKEVRAFKNRRGITAFRDAQGFRKLEKRLNVLPANARVFHYGYVRNPDSMKAKSKEMSRWWGKKPVTDETQLQPKRHVGLRRFKKLHPAVMQDRIINYREKFDPKDYYRVWDRNEIKNAVTLIWETLFPFRIGEFRNYEYYKR